MTRELIAPPADGLDCHQNPELPLEFIAVSVVAEAEERKDRTEKFTLKGYPTGILFRGNGEVGRHAGNQRIKHTDWFLRKTTTAAK